MKISILTLFPEMFEGFVNTSIISRSIKNDIVEIEVVNIRDYTVDAHNNVDDTPYGGGRGMVLQCQPVIDCIKDVRTKDSVVVYMGPCGKTFNQNMAKEMSKINHLVILCGHYEGIDERIKNYIDIEVSIGDYILTGGELASMVISDAIIRLLKGSIKEDSHINESFEDNLLEHPHYTKPEVYDGMSVPKVLLSGHHENIRKYRLKESLRKTYLNRLDMLEIKKLNKEEKLMLEQIVEEESEKN